MNFFKRFRSYLIGVILGMLVVVVVFKDKANLFTSWLPENRVLLEISEKKLITTPKSACQLQCLGKTAADIKTRLLEKTSVEFAKSDTHSKPKKYCLMQDFDGTPTCIMVAIQDSTVAIDEIKSGNTLTCDC